MLFPTVCTLLTFSSLVSLVTAKPGCCDGLTVHTTSGTVHGTLNETYPGVRRFLSIPYAAPPVGDLRWEPPQAYTPNGDINATAYGPACPQFTSNATGGFYSLSPGFGTTPTLLSEDCLTLSVYAPQLEEGACNGNKPGLPVVIWIFGGGFNTGGVNTPYEYPDRWIQRSNGLIFIAMNYRVNIFGFPRAAGASDQNLCQLDQRFAMEWARNNVANFGGDPDRMVLLGQSSGGASIDLQVYTNIDDPIVSGAISHSGNVEIEFGLLKQLNDTGNFTFVASHLGCGGLDPAAEIACMRNVSWQSIEGFLEEWSNALETPPLSWGPVVDEKVIFSDYPERSLNGLVADIPTIQGYDYQDSIAFWSPFSNQTGPLNYTAWEDYQEDDWVCPGVIESQQRVNGNRTMYRFVYNGTFPNISPVPWMGAFHASEIPILFGNHQDWPTGPPSTPREYAVSHAWQDLYLAFANDSKNGLRANGWDPITENGGDYLVFGAPNNTVTYMDWSDILQQCLMIQTG